MKVNVTKFKGKIIPVSEWFGVDAYEKTESEETLFFTRIFDTDFGNMLAKFDLHKDTESGMWVGKMEACVVDNKGTPVWSNIPVAYTSEDLFLIKEGSSKEIPIQELADEYSASENVENFHIHWNNNDETNNERIVNFFGSRFIGDSHWIVTAEVQQDDEGETIFIGVLSDFQVLDLIECFAEKYERKYFS